MARKIFYHRRSRRRVLAAAGLALSALLFFTAGLYTGLNLAPQFTPGHLSGPTERTAALAAAEF
ncbi:MAG: hypothetical protein U0942_03980 [Parvibaculum sp.]|uniref:hypothetical protein n=1 Tax=Parvibaculum sp. TaxID=2024848 RepID=UPI000CAD8FE9|nr:hypothetical protein [Parvibaculum sp.]MDZ4380479.1 hypothetical protein [Parvibaculum sp.]PKP77164.1 MAG: hypothetical protein CVT81_10915 [Alphaproteobacteria bacterium HGW-Alphaproteobacteria-3]